jgi:hypothetical protein
VDDYWFSYVYKLSDGADARLAPGCWSPAGRVGTLTRSTSETGTRPRCSSSLLPELAGSRSDGQSGRSRSSSRTPPSGSRRQGHPRPAQCARPRFRRRQIGRQIADYRDHWRSEARRIRAMGARRQAKRDSR